MCFLFLSQAPFPFSRCKSGAKPKFCKVRAR